VQLAGNTRIVLACVAALLSLAACTESKVSSGPVPPPGPIVPGPACTASSFAPPPSSPVTPGFDGRVVDVALRHNALVYDACRNVYYASIPGSEPSGNSIATIDIAGQVTYSAPIGSEPNALAIAIDGSLLYVGLDGTGDVAKLALPSMTELGRTRLVNDSFLGQTRARTLAVSPVDLSVVAVSMKYLAVFPDHAGVGLLRHLAMLPKRTQVHTGSNLVAFDSSGTTLFGTGGFDLRRIQVVSDGLAENLVVSTSLSAGAVAFAGGRITLGSKQFEPANLDALGKVSTPSDCMPRRSGNQLLCADTDEFNSGSSSILLADAGTFVIGASLRYASSESGFQRRMIEGPTGQVAISYPADPGISRSSLVRLFASAQLAAPLAPPPPSWPVTPASTVDGQALDIGLVHNALVYDGGRNVYYASVPGSVIGAGNSIATIDPATGAVAHSGPIGSEPNALAIAPDGSALYVGLDGSGELLRLALPSMTPAVRTRLPVDSSGPTHPATIAASPADATLVAVSLAYTNVSPPHAGVALLRNMVVQPKRTQGHTGSNVVAFDPSGVLYGLNIDGGDFGLRRIQVLADGLAEQLLLREATTIRRETLGFANGRIVAGQMLFDASTFMPLGMISTASDCKPRTSGNLLLCFDTIDFTNGPAHILLADADTSVIQASLLYADNQAIGSRNLVEGPAGQIAIGIPADIFGDTPGIRLFTSAKLVTPPVSPPPSWPVTSSSTADGQSLVVGLVHNSLVYDVARNVYYASVPGSVIGAGNTIATIDPATGAVAHSATIGSEPNALAIAADGSALYVGLDGSSEVLRLALPSMTPSGRTRLTVFSSFGRQRAAGIAVSPTDAGAAAVSLAYFVAAPDPGVALLRDMAMQPKIARTSLGSSFLVFDAAGAKVFSMGNVSGPELNRIGVLADGLILESGLFAPIALGVRALSFGSSRTIAGNAVFDAPALTLLGTISGAPDCWAARVGSALLCFGERIGPEGRVLTADSGTFAVGASLVYTPFEVDPPRRLVQGPSGQIGISYVPVFATPSVRLFTSAQLP